MRTSVCVPCLAFTEPLFTDVFLQVSASSAVASADVSFAYVSPPPPLPHVTHLSDVGLPSSLQLLCFLLTSSLCSPS